MSGTEPSDIEILMSFYYRRWRQARKLLGRSIVLVLLSTALALSKGWIWPLVIAIFSSGIVIASLEATRFYGERWRRLMELGDHVAKRQISWHQLRRNAKNN